MDLESWYEGTYFRISVVKVERMLPCHCLESELLYFLYILTHCLADRKNHLVCKNNLFH